MSLPPYPAYKPSGVPWLVSIPAHWSIRRNGGLFELRRDTGFPDLPILEVSLRTGVRVRHLEGTIRKKMMSDRSGYIRAGKNDIVYNMMRMWQGAVGVPPQDGLVSPAYIVARPRGLALSRYYEYLFRTDSYMTEMDKYSYGIVKDRNRLYWHRFKQMPSLHPPLPEQRAIVRFLDHHDRLIRRYIRAKQRLIALLTEQKQAVIQRAVTRGLDPDGPLKPSDTSWLGDMPAHWDLLPGRMCYREKKVPNAGLEETTVLSLSYGRIVIRPEEKLHGLVPASFETYQIVEPGDVICRGTDLQNDKNSLRFGLSEHRGIITSAYMNLSSQASLCKEYGYFLLHAYDLNKVFYGLGSGLRQNLGWHDFKYLPCLVPPLTEQAAIVRYLDETTSELDRAIAAAQREIDLLREYRTRLIADVVTGKVDVRAAAAALPEEEPEDVDPDDALVEDEEMADEELEDTVMEDEG